MNTVRDIVEALGRQEIADALDLENTKSVYPSIANGHFPAAWYIGLKKLGEKKGVQIPDSLFRWKIPADDDTHTAA